MIIIEKKIQILSIDFEKLHTGAMDISNHSLKVEILAPRFIAEFIQFLMPN